MTMMTMTAEMALAAMSVTAGTVMTVITTMRVMTDSTAVAMMTAKNQRVVDLYVFGIRKHIYGI